MPPPVDPYGTTRPAAAKLSALLDAVCEGGGEDAGWCRNAVEWAAFNGLVGEAYDEFSWLLASPGVAGARDEQLVCRAAAALCFDDEALCSRLAVELATSQRVGRIDGGGWSIAGVRVGEDDGWACIDAVRQMCARLTAGEDGGAALAAAHERLAGAGRRAHDALDSAWLELGDTTPVVCLSHAGGSAAWAGEAVLVRFAPWALAWRVQRRSTRWGAVMPRNLALRVGEIAGVAAGGDHEAAVLAAELWDPRGGGALAQGAAALDAARAVLAAPA